MLAANWVSDLLGTAMDLWNNYIARAFRMLLADPRSSEPWGNVAAIIESLITLTKGLGVGILTLCFLIGIARQYSSWQEMKRPEQIAPLFLRFTLALTITVKGVDILWGIVDFGQSLARSFTEGRVIGEDLKMAWPEEMMAVVENDLGLFERIPFLVAALIAVIGFFVIAISILLTIYGRFFELYMHMAMSSIMLPTLASQTTERIGWTYLKGFLGISLRAAVIGIAFVIFSSLWDPANMPLKGSGASMVWEAMAERAFYMLLLSVTVKASDTIVGKMLGG